MPRLATRCLCVLSTWLVVCLVPCAPMSIVCPLPSCYLIIVSVAPAVSPSLPLFVSLYSLLVSAVLCWSVVLRHVTFMFDCAPVFCLPACLPACLFFPFGVVFVALLFHFIILNLISSALESSTSSLTWQNGSATTRTQQRGQPWVQVIKFSTSTRETRPLRFTPGTLWEWLASRLRRRPASWCFFGEA